MKIIVIGAGAMGCLYGAYLSKHNDVTMLDVYEPQVESINQNGITVLEEDGTEQHFSNIRAMKSGTCKEVADLVIVFVKSTHTESSPRRKQRAVRRKHPGDDLAERRRQRPPNCEVRQNREHHHRHQQAQLGESGRRQDPAQRQRCDHHRQQSGRKRPSSDGRRPAERSGLLICCFR